MFYLQVVWFCALSAWVGGRGSVLWIFNRKAENSSPQNHTLMVCNVSGTIPLSGRIYISLVWVLNWNKLSSEEAQVWTPHKRKEHCSSGPTVIWGWQLVFHCWFCCIYWIRVKPLLSYSGVKDGRQFFFSQRIRSQGNKNCVKKYCTWRAQKIQ